MIDVGGPSMLRGAAKNFAHCAPVCRPEQYDQRARGAARRAASSRSRRAAASRPRRSRTPPPTRPRSRRGSTRARSSPTRSSSRSTRCSTSRTARTRTSAPRTTPSAASRRHLLSRVEQLHGKELSFNNLNDFSAARSLAREFALPACVIVKHANPCGVAVGDDDRGGVRQGARLRPDLGVRRRRRPQPPGRGAARREARGAVRRGAVRARLRRGRARRAAAQAEHPHPPRRRAARGRRPASATTSACSAACSCRTPTPRSRSATTGSS